MYKRNMTDVPAKIRAKIFGKLDERGLESVHIGYGSMLEGDDNLFVVIARDPEHRGYDGYSVFSYEPDDSRWNGRLFREANSLTYPDALIEMGGRIKE